MSKLLTILLLCLSGCGFARYEGFEYGTVWKDVGGEASIEKPDGTKITIKLTSNINVDLVRAAAEGAVRGAVKP